MATGLTTKARRPRETGTRHSWAALRAGGRPIRVEWSSRCARCGGRIRVGQQAVYLGTRCGRGSTVVHPSDEGCLASSGTYTDGMMAVGLDEVD